MKLVQIGTALMILVSIGLIGKLYLFIWTDFKIISVFSRVLMTMGLTAFVLFAMDLFMIINKKETKK